MEEKVETILCVPGSWNNRNEFLEKIVKESGGYIFAGELLVHIETQDVFNLEFVEGYQSQITEAFKAAGSHWKDTPEMKSITTHKSAVYITCEGGTIEAAHAIMLAANGLLKAGGLAVSVETTGLAHSKEDWNEQCKYNFLFKSHTSYVVYVSDSEETYSCGMHNFGLPEAIICNSDSSNPSELLKTFTLYLLSESPKINNGQTFSSDVDAPIYQIVESKPIDFGKDSLFNNPFGMWRLQLITSM